MKLTQYYFIRAGVNGKYWEEFRTNNFVAVDYVNENLDPEATGDFDLSGLTKDEIEKRKGNSNDVTELYHISNIKKGDIIAVVNDLKTVKEFAIATSNYYFEESAKKNKHRVNVEYLNFGSLEIGNGVQKGIMRDDSQKIKNFLAKDTLEYFILRHSEKDKGDQKWKDEVGKKYHVGRQDNGNMGQNVQKLLNAKVGSKAVWISKSIGGSIFVLGHSIKKTQEIINENKDWYVVFEDFIEFQDTKMSPEIHSEIKSLENNSNYNWQHSINKIPKKLYQLIIGEDLTPDEDKKDTVSNDDYARGLELKPNLILYGPPGTGKTYHAKVIAEKIASTKNVTKMKDPTWKSLAALVLLENDGTPLNYHEIAKRALSKNLIETQAETPAETIARDMRIDMEERKEQSLFVKDTEGVYGLNLPTTFEKAAEMILLAKNEPMHSDKIMEIALERNMINQKEKAGITPNRSMNQILSQDVKNNDSNSKFVKTLPGTYALRSQFYCEKKILISRVTFHPSYSYEDFVEGFRPNVSGDGEQPYILDDGIFKQICNEAKNDLKNKYVIIIDEINRGNIPKIFGELITLIEEDKRKSDNSLQLTYSKDDFFVPKNVIIIGTMNTADKSLMQMDDALKRRFAFEELMPDPELLEQHLNEINIPHAEDYSKILTRINKKITGDGKNNDLMNQFRDRQIGHSYFWNIGKNSSDPGDDLQKIIKYDIIPLLQDYFYGDYSKIREILGGKDENEFVLIDKDNRTTNLINDIEQCTELREKLLEILE